MTAITREWIERFDREHKEDLAALECLLRALPADMFNRLANIPAIRSRIEAYRAAEQEANQ
ncbi:hypothetical protein [Sinorhizobium fredii]|uniref:hypothetical protein n=1 Tax=Rhizobium fredii TaxID=380 RepID=UPI0004AEA543|nr:hypothetical protein [Sinorhizobium fredii]AWI57036.1 hypothetical protein AB395_00001370 [Sinorhizobium fredii CCBAU 45436]